MLAHALAAPACKAGVIAATCHRDSVGHVVPR